MDPLTAEGVAVQVDGLLALRHLARDGEAAISPTGMPGGFVTRKRGRGLETADIRVFEQGDDIRHIDRNATARTGIPHVRTFQDERDRTVLLLADFRPPMLWGTRRAFRSVAAAEMLSLVGWRAVRSGGRVGLIAFGASEPSVVAARGRERGMIAVIGAMAEAHRAALDEGRPQPLARMLSMAEQIVPRGASVCLASSLDDVGDGFEMAASSLAHRADLTVFRVRDAFETGAPDGTYPFETASGRRGIGTVGRDATGEDPLRDMLARLDIATVDVDASLAPDRQTGAWFGG